MCEDGTVGVCICCIVQEAAESSLGKDIKTQVATVHHFVGNVCKPCYCTLT